MHNRNLTVGTVFFMTINIKNENYSLKKKIDVVNLFGYIDMLKPIMRELTYIAPRMLT